MSVRVDDRDFGWRRIQREIRKFKRSETVVGLFGEGSDPEVNLAARGVVHEKGSLDGRIPRRPFMSTAFDEGLAQLQRVIDREHSQILAGRSNAKKALAELGEFHTSQIQKKIDRGPFEGLKPRTIRLKGSSKPLIDTVQMRNSITHQEKMS